VRRFPGSHFSIEQSRLEFRGLASWEQHQVLSGELISSERAARAEPPFESKEPEASREGAGSGAIRWDRWAIVPLDGATHSPYM
jgi:hypothetical protein